MNKKDNIRESPSASNDVAKIEESSQICLTNNDCLVSISLNITEPSDRKGSISTMSGTSCGGLDMPSAAISTGKDDHAQ